MSGTVVVLGAGATKSCGGPLTSEILHGMAASFTSAADPNWPPLSMFLQQVFHVAPGAPSERYPGLPLLMSLLDTALQRRQGFQAGWDAEQMSKVRHGVERGIYDLLELQLNKAPTTVQYELLQRLYPAGPLPRPVPKIISMNYDLLIDTAMMAHSQSFGGEGHFPDYCCDIQTESYRQDARNCGTLLKLHGSLNWLYCSSCQRLELGASESKRYLKAVDRLLAASPERSLGTAYLALGSKCPCGTELRPLLVAPSHLKDYQNPHLSQVWYQAERMLREADRVIFVGYSLPDDDVEVVYLFKRCLAHLQPAQITVVDLDDQKRTLDAHPVGLRYRTLFGDGVDWHTDGVKPWVAMQPIVPPAPIPAAGPATST